MAATRRYTPDYDAPLDAYLRNLDENGMTHGVLVQPSFLGTDNSFLAECLLAARGRLRGIAVVAPDAQDTELSRLNDAGVVGLRLNLIGEAIPDLGAPQWRDLLGRAAALGWQIEIQRAARDLAALVPALLDFGSDVVIDHYGLPDPALGIGEPAYADLLKHGASGRLWMKMSAPYRNGSAGEDFAQAAVPLLREQLGRDRLLWGSDWPHTGFEGLQSYARNRGFLNLLVSDDSERAKVLANPKTLFKF